MTGRVNVASWIRPPAQSAYRASLGCHTKGGNLRAGTFIPMATHKVTARKTARPKQRTSPSKPRRARRAHLLIIECDSRKLAADGLNLGTAFAQLARTLFPDKRIAVVKTTSEENLKEELAAAFHTHGRFRSILIVGHSDATGLMLTADGPRTWESVGKWLQIFEPEFCFLAACSAGNSEAVRGLFQPVKTLRHIYGSPVILHKIQTTPLGILIWMLLKDGRLDEDQSGALRIVNYAMTGGQIYRWKRADTGMGAEVQPKLWDGIAKVLDLGPWDLLS